VGVGWEIDWNVSLLATWGGGKEEGYPADQGGKLRVGRASRKEKIVEGGF